MIQICLCLYKRHHRLPKLMKQLANQTYQDFKVNIWNNDGSKFVDVRNLGKARVKIVYNGANQGSEARFKLVSKISGNPIIFIDDDLELEPDFIEYYYSQYKKYPNSICGWWSKKWEEENYHKDIDKLPEGWFADYIGTGGMILDREIFDKEKCLQNIPKQYAKVEDIYLSVIARKRGMDLISIKPKCKIIYDGNDQYKKLKEYKQKAFLSLRKDGWKLLKEL